MIGPETIVEIIATYKKHGWILRRLMLNDASTRQILDRVEQGVEIRSSDINAAWFSRPPQPGGIAWELRNLAEPPFALLENVDENIPEFEDRLLAVETRFRESLGRRTVNNPHSSTKITA